MKGKFCPLKNHQKREVLFDCNEPKKRRVLVLGNGPSLCDITDWNIMFTLKSKGFQIICMNKILRFFRSQKITSLPQNYIATDVLVNAQIAHEILQFKNKFERMCIGKPYEMNDRYIVKRSGWKQYPCSDWNISGSDACKNMNELLQQHRVQSVEHQTTGLAALQWACNMQADEIYMLGMDETYLLPPNNGKMNENQDTAKRLSNSYFCNDYIRLGDIVSEVSTSRIKMMKSFVQKCSRKAKIFNLGHSRSCLPGDSSLDFKAFCNKFGY